MKRSYIIFLALAGVVLAGCGGSQTHYIRAMIKDRWGNAAYYLIGKDVPIQDNCEGKVLGAFLMAAAEYERL